MPTLPKECTYVAYGFQSFFYFRRGILVDVCVCTFYCKRWYYALHCLFYVHVLTDSVCGCECASEHVYIYKSMSTSIHCTYYVYVCVWGGGGRGIIT